VIIHHIASDFFMPELLAGSRPFEEMTIMLMPEATVDENHRSMLGEY